MAIHQVDSPFDRVFEVCLQAHRLTKHHIAVSLSAVALEGIRESNVHHSRRGNSTQRPFVNRGLIIGW